MAFWKEKSTPTKRILDDFRKINGQLRNLLNLKFTPERVNDAKKEITALFSSIAKNLKDAEAAILERAEELKQKPWLPVTYDGAIDQLAQQELEEIEQFAKDLTSYKDELQSAEEQEDIEALHELLAEEEHHIEEREKKCENSIAQWEAESFKKKIKETPVPAQKTTDGVPWKNIASVVAQLGGTIQPAGKHAVKIVLPNAHQPISLSGDVHSGVIAKQIIQQLKYSMDNRKWKLLKKNKMRQALEAGDLRAAA